MLCVNLCIVGTHGTIASERAPGVAVAGVRKRVIFDLIVPRLHQLKNGAIAVNRRRTRSVSDTADITTDDELLVQADLVTRLRFQTLIMSDLGENLLEGGCSLHSGLREHGNLTDFDLWKAETPKNSIYGAECWLSGLCSLHVLRFPSTVVKI